METKKETIITGNNRGNHYEEKQFWEPNKWNREKRQTKSNVIINN